LLLKVLDSLRFSTDANPTEVRLLYHCTSKLHGPIRIG